MSQEITTQSWLSRIGGAFVGVFIGIAFIIGAFFLIFWNESHGFHTFQSLQKTLQVLISVPNSPVDSKYDHKVVYFTGKAITPDTLTDPLFAVTVNAIALKRNVQMYQWKQDEESHEEKQLGGSEQTVKTYTYKQVWSDELIDSSNFHDADGHQNPGGMAISSQTQQAQHVTVGDFSLPQDLISNISVETPIDLTNANVTILQTKFNKPVHHDNNGLYIGENNTSPKIGDLRININEVLPQDVSVIGQQADHTVQPYAAEPGQQVQLLVSGDQSPQQMIQTAETQNQIMTWIWRAVSLFLMIIGIALMLRPISVLADVIPLFGNIVGFGTGLIAFMLGLMLWSVATAIAWVVVRPLMAIGLIIIVVIICVCLYRMRKH